VYDHTTFEHTTFDYMTTDNPMDELARYNKERWEALAQAGVAFSRPFLDLTPASAQTLVDGQGLIGPMAGKEVLCLAGGGGQQSAAFALLGARVTVLDLAETPLQRDQEAARHYGVAVRTEQGDMRDLSRFADDAFDVVWHAHSINFVPDTRPVFDGVARVLRPGGLYHLSFHNPFTHGVDDARWNGVGYPLRLPYVDGAEIVQEEAFLNPDWEFEDATGVVQRIKGPREFRHTLSTLLNGLIDRGFRLLHLEEQTGDQPDPIPGSWPHYLLVTAPYLSLWAVYKA
jgi:2-polyprenyl-3-methyl-5-hydroxy-6-metoxy-1,4-benzoquinol methylase